MPAQELTVCDSVSCQASVSVTQVFLAHICYDSTAIWPGLSLPFLPAHSHQRLALIMELNRLGHAMATPLYDVARVEGGSVGDFLDDGMVADWVLLYYLVIATLSVLSRLPIIDQASYRRQTTN